MANPDGSSTATDHGARRRNRWIYLTLALWGVAVSAGAAQLWRYQLTPGATPGPATQAWPIDAPIPSHAGKAVLIMVAHPQCACTRASLNELRRLSARFAGLENPPVMYLSIVPTKGPKGDAIDGPVLRNASSIEGLQVAIDPDGAFAARLGATTSGHTLLYGAAGELLYSGGITAARGHEGDAVGQDAILAVLYGKPAAVKDAPVFGCGLHPSASPS